MIPCFTTTAAAAIGCLCPPTPPACEAYWTASSVFVGSVVDTSFAKIKDRQYRTIRLSVEKAFSGVQSKEITVLTGMSDSDCGYGFGRGGVYLVYTSKHPELDGPIAISCGRTRRLSDADEDLEYIRRLPQAPPGGRIYGVVHKSNWRQALEGVRVSISGPGRRLDTYTGREGEYQFAKLPPGRYQMRLSYPGFVSHTSEYSVDLHDRGCAQVDLPMAWNGRIGGKVFDASGQPAPNVAIQIVPADSKAGYVPDLSANSGPDGRYELDEVPPGRYLLGINLNRSASAQHPYPRTYYPGVRNPAAAVVVALDDAHPAEEADLHIPPPLRERVVEGVVLWPDGRPATGANVSLEDPDAKGQFISTPVDSQGRFSLKAFEGIPYWLGTTISTPDGKFMCAQTVDVPARGAVKPQVLVVSLPAPTCQANYRARH